MEAVRRKGGFMIIGKIIIKSTGERIFEDAVNLEKKLWNREDYGEEDITLFSNIMDYIENNKEDFINSFEE